MPLFCFAGIFCFYYFFLYDTNAWGESYIISSLEKSLIFWSRSSDLIKNPFISNCTWSLFRWNSIQPESFVKMRRMDNEWLLFNAKSTIFQLYYVENKLYLVKWDESCFVLHRHAELDFFSASTDAITPSPFVRRIWGLFRAYSVRKIMLRGT